MRPLRLHVLVATSIVLVFALSGWGCASAETIPLLRAAGAPIVAPPPPGTVLEVVTRSTAVKDPLPVEGTPVSYAELENALGISVSTATAAWAKDRAGTAPLMLTVELVQADARKDGERLVVGFGVRATLRTRAGNSYLAQTQASCRQASLAPADRGAPVVYSCLGRLAEDLASWLHVAGNGPI